MTDIAPGTNGRVFISYSRKDKPFVQKLNEALDGAGVQAWVDWEGIELASDWMDTIADAIRSNDAFLFVISPDSLTSSVCTEELELSLQLNKKLIPILYREPGKGSPMHPRLASTNWVYLRPEDDFEATLPKLIDSVNTDLSWVRQHTRLLEQALEWDRRQRNNSFLLNGTELEEAESWAARASEQANRQITPVQAEYINASRRYATRRQRMFLAGVSLALVVSILLSIFAWIARNDARAQQQRAETSEALAIQREQEASTARAIAQQNERTALEQRAIAETNERIARAQRNIALAQSLQARAGELDTSTLLAIEAYLENPTADAESLIRSNLSLLAEPVARMSQDGAIWTIEWSPDYEYFATANSHDPSEPEAVNEACVYRAVDGTVLFCREHDDDVNDAIFTKDGRYLVTASSDRTVKFWDAKDGSLVDELRLEGAALDLDASSSVVAIGREDAVLTLYYLDKPDLKPVDKAQADGVAAVRFSPSGDTLAFGLLNGQVRFWQSRGDYFYNGPQHPRSSYTVLAWSPDSLWLASGGGDSVARLTKRDGTLQYQVQHQDWVEGIAFGPDPDWYATASDDNIVRVIDRATGTEKFRMAHADFAQKVAVSLDGQWIASTGYDEVVRVWDSISGSQMLEMPLDSNGSAVSFNQDGTRLVAADEDGNIGIWDISVLKSRRNTIAFPEFVQEARFTPSGEYLLVNADDFNLWKIPAGEVDRIGSGTQGEVVLTADSLTYDMAISPDSGWAAVVEYDSENTRRNRSTLVSLDGTVRLPLDHGGEVTGVEFTSDSRQVATSGVDGWIRFWAVPSGDRLQGLDNAKKVYSLAISPAGRLAAAGLEDKTRIWDLDAGEALLDLDQAGDISSLAFSPDGSLLATGSADGTVLLWRVEGTRLVSSGGPLHLNGAPRFLAFGPGNRWLAGGDSTGFAYLWDVDGAQELARIPHGQAVTSVAFSRDGSSLLTVSRKVVRVWDVASIPLVPTGRLVELACSRLAVIPGQSSTSICSPAAIEP